MLWTSMITKCWIIKKPFKVPNPLWTIKSQNKIANKNANKQCSPFNFILKDKTGEKTISNSKTNQWTLIIQ